MEGFGYAQRSYEAQRGVAKAAWAQVQALRQRGVADDNPVMQSAMRQAEAAQTDATMAGLNRADVPLPVGLQRERSATDYQLQVLGMMPGTYGSVRGLLGRSMHESEQEAQTIRARMEQQRWANGGQLSEAEELRYQEQLQQVGLRQAGTFEQLS